MNFSEACIKTVELAQKDKRTTYLYKHRGGNFSWGISHNYWKDWLFKVYPGGRKVLSVEGTKLMRKENIEQQELFE